HTWGLALSQMRQVTLCIAGPSWGARELSALCPWERGPRADRGPPTGEATPARSAPHCQSLTGLGEGPRILVTHSPVVRACPRPSGGVVAPGRPAVHPDARADLQ